MKRNTVAAWLSMMAASVALLGCYETARPDFGPRTSVAVAKQVCEINALAEEHDAVISTMNSPDYGRDMDTKDHRYTILRDKLDHYAAEVDASYRFVTANCNSYNLCMAKNNFDEHACADTRRAWVDSHAKFNELAISIKEIEAPNWRHRRHHGGDRADGCRAGECDTQGGVFANGCCYDGD